MPARRQRKRSEDNTIRTGRKKNIRKERERRNMSENQERKGRKKERI